MGKTKKTRVKRGKSFAEAENSLEEEVAIDCKENTIQTVIDQLQGANVEEKYCGLQTFALLIESPENIELIMSQGLVKLIGPLLLDSVNSVRNSAAGALRNLSTKQEVCDGMMDQDIMTPLVMFFHEHAESWTPSDLKTKDEEAETLVNSINLLLNLCESTDLAIKYLGQSRVLDILSRYLSLSTFGEEIVIAVLQCLFVVTEDNPSAVEKIKSTCDRHLQELMCIDSNENESSKLLIKTLVSGVIINLCGGNIGSLPVDVINQILSTIAYTLQVDHRKICNQASSSVPLMNGAGKAESPKGKAAQELEKILKSVSQMIDAQQSSIEIMTNICACDNGDDSENEGESSDSEEMGDEDHNNSSDATVYAEDKVPTQVMEALISLEIFNKVWSKTQLPAENVMLILKEYEGSQLIHKKLHNLQVAALLCVNNMLSVLPIESLSGVNGVYKIWMDAGKIVFKQKSENVHLLESATAVMRAALDKIKFRENGNTSQHNLFNEIALSDIEMMITGIKECQVSEIRSNLIRMIGLLALLLVNSLNDVTSNVICIITESILEQAHKENEVWVLAEAIDTIVDLYSEDETDILAAKIKLPEKLSTLAPILKNKLQTLAHLPREDINDGWLYHRLENAIRYESKARQQKRLPKEYRVLVSTATSNLPRFIKYKKERISKLTQK